MGSKEKPGEEVFAQVMGTWTRSWLLALVTNFP